MTTLGNRRISFVPRHAHTLSVPQSCGAPSFHIGGCQTPGAMTGLRPTASSLDPHTRPEDHTSPRLRARYPIEIP